jgi:hypothetical protein
MKINEVANIEAEELFESLKSDTEQPFSEETLKEISNVVANTKFHPPLTTMEEIDKWLDSL